MKTPKEPYWKQHPEIWNIPCTYCDMKCKTEGGLKRHVTVCHKASHGVWLSEQRDIIQGAMKYATKEQNRTVKVANAMTDIAKSMVKEIANEYIDVEDTSSGRSAQRFWYEHGIEILQAYVRKLELAYKK
jgi:hypothetical protein